MTGITPSHNHAPWARLGALILLSLLILWLAAMQFVSVSHAASWHPERCEEPGQVALLVLPDGRIRSPRTVDQAIPVAEDGPTRASFSYLVTLVQGAATHSILSPGQYPGQRD